MPKESAAIPRTVQIIFADAVGKMKRKRPSRILTRERCEKEDLKLIILNN